MTSFVAAVSLLSRVFSVNVQSDVQHVSGSFAQGNRDGVVSLQGGGLVQKTCGASPFASEDRGAERDQPQGRINCAGAAKKLARFSTAWADS
jgi:hypothetical protein